MRLDEDIRSITYMKMKSAELVREVADTRRPVVITQNGEARAVVLDVASYQALRDAALLMKLVSQSEESARAGRTSAQSSVFARIDARIAAAREDAAKGKATTTRSRSTAGRRRLRR